jgi:glyoxylase-like metal-dependent hydrolase (beta-lactamase superfamily II)
MPVSYRIGDLTVHALTDGVCWMDAGGVFGIIPKPLWLKVAQPDDANRVPMALRCLLVESEGKRILVETGFGPKLPPKQRDIFAIPQSLLLSELAAIGLGPEAVDAVIVTHLHGDHAGGLTTIRDGVAAPTFPRARVYVQKREWADAAAPNERTAGLYLAENVRPLDDAGLVEGVSGDRWITREVGVLETPGHTRGHQSVFIRSGRESAVFLGDLAPTATHLERLGWTTAFDTEPLITLESKKTLLARLARDGSTVFFTHDPRMAAGRVEPQDKGIRVVPVEPER